MPPSLSHFAYIQNDEQLDRTPLPPQSAGLEVVIRVGLRVYAGDDLLRQLLVEARDHVQVDGVRGREVGQQHERGRRSERHRWRR